MINVHADTDVALRERIAVHRGLPSPAVRRALREANGLTLREVAEAIGVSVTAAWYWENGMRSPRGANLDRYVTALKLMRDEAR